MTPDPNEDFIDQAMYSATHGTEVSVSPSRIGIPSSEGVGDGDGIDSGTGVDVPPTD